MSGLTWRQGQACVTLRFPRSYRLTPLKNKPQRPVGFCYSSLPERVLIFTFGAEMASARSRRDFLKLSARGTAVLAGAAALGRLGSASTVGPPGNLSLWITDGTQRLKRAPSVVWQSATGSSAQDTVVLDPDKKFQEILGFGAAFTDASCFIFNRLDPVAREKLFSSGGNKSG